MYVRWKNKSKWVYKRRYKDVTVEDVFYSVQPTNTYPGWRKNFLVLYKAMKMNPDSKVLVHMVNDAYISLQDTKKRWEFAEKVYEQIKEKLQENAKN